MMKKAKELCSNDFEQFPVWKSVMEENVTTAFSVEPITDENVYDNHHNLDGFAFEVLFVKAQFVSDNGRTFDGYCKIGTTVSVFSVSEYKPVIFTETGKVEFWVNDGDNIKEIVANGYMDLRINPQNLFPLTIKLFSTIGLFPKEALMDGFYYLNDKFNEQRIVNI